MERDLGSLRDGGGTSLIRTTEEEEMRYQRGGEGRYKQFADNPELTSREKDEKD